MANESFTIDGLLDPDSALTVREKMEGAGRKLVWTNGCFDILHVGHVIYLQNARSLGDLLMVGLNSDLSYRKWKNKPGPINNQTRRAKVLLGLSCVDFVLVFDEISPRNMLEEIRPHVFVKGDDYNIDTLDQEERKIVENYGGSIRFCSGVKGISTSVIVEKILKLYA